MIYGPLHAELGSRIAWMVTFGRSARRVIGDECRRFTFSICMKALPIMF
jgi:hypothetical protein